LTRRRISIYKFNTFYRQVNPLRLAWVDLLDRYDWTWFTTLTFRDLPKTYTAINRTKKWLRAIRNEERVYIPWYMCLEFTKRLNWPHIHLLMANLEGVSRKKWWFEWYTRYGGARIKPYKKELGATHYLCKYVVKDTGNSALFEVRGLKWLDRHLDKEK